MRIAERTSTVAKVLEDGIDDTLASWLEAQPIFFVASAPLAADCHVNVSPKGGDTLRILGPFAACYLEYTGSGAETLAHLRENGRLTIMCCAFDGRPKIVRLFGTAAAHLPGSPRFAELMPRFTDPGPGIRSIIDLNIDRVQSSCGFGVPLMDFVEQRDLMETWANKKGDGISQYWIDKNAVSIDGLPAHPAAESAE